MGNLISISATDIINLILRKLWPICMKYYKKIINYGFYNKQDTNSLCNADMSFYIYKSHKLKF